MPRLAGVDIPENKRIVIALTYLYGIGKTISQTLLARTQIDPNTRAKDLSGQDLATLQKMLEDYMIEGDLRKTVRENIERLKRTGTYRGMRHSQGLPVRGQRTRTNARTKRGKRKTIGAMKKEELTKTAPTKKETAG